MAQGRVDIHIGAQTREFAAGATRVKGQLNDLSTQILKLPGARQLGELLTNPIVAATAAATGLVRMMGAAVNHAQKLRDISAQMGGSIREAQGLLYGAAISGAQPEQLITMMSQLRRTSGEALAGRKEQLGAFTALGIGTEDLNNMGPVELFQRIASKFRDGAASARDYAAATKLLGEQFRNLLPAIQRGLVGAMAGERAFDIPANENRAVAALEEDLGESSAMAGGWFRRARSYLATGLFGLGRFGVAAIANVRAQFPGGEADAELRDMMLLQREMAFGADTQTGVERLQRILDQRQTARTALEDLRQSNLSATFDARFKGLSAADQLSVMQGAYGAGMSGMGNLSPIQAEQQAAALIQLQQDILATQEKALKELETLNATLTDPD